MARPRVSLGPGTQSIVVFALLRRFALNLFRLDATRTKNLPRKRKAAAWNSRYVVDLLNLRPLEDI